MTCKKINGFGNRKAWQYFFLQISTKKVVKAIEKGINIHNAWHNRLQENMLSKIVVSKYILLLRLLFSKIDLSCGGKIFGCFCYLYFLHTMHFRIFY